MADLPVIERILATLVGELRAIATPTFSQTVAGVHRAWPNEAQRKEALPAIYVFSGQEQKFVAGTEGAALGTAFGHQGNLLELNVVFLAKCARTDREAVGRAFYSDIEAVLLAQPDRVIAGSTVHLEAYRLGLYVQDIYEDEAGGHSQFLLQYDTKLGDPRTGVGG